MQVQQGDGLFKYSKEIVCLSPARRLFVQVDEEAGWLKSRYEVVVQVEQRGGQGKSSKVVL